ncbi:methyltransferase [Amycolatopsis sp. MJM2582]|uniref:methyltransferase n=1 Tax=Amycolatopsis TaxID=1813 RepID=UPI0004D1597E|nr:methyltransferase [Amycolatopsis sp. MJM2582]AHF20598.1 methyltransferase [Amycolatopsis sp. MJM2582]KFZ77414.1 methyltransferase [Amycolatopsis sp. MJM2582]
MQESLDSTEVHRRFQLIANGPALFNAVVSGIELDIFDFLEERGGADAAALGEFTGLEPHKVRVLMLALTTSGLIEKRGVDYVNHPVATELLATTGPESWQHILLSWKTIYYPAFARMTSALRAGTNEALDALEGPGDTLYARLGNDPEKARIFYTAMSAFSLQTMPGLLEHIDVKSSRHLLDVGGGDGTTAAALLKANPGLKATLLDLASSVALAEQRVPAEVTDRLTLHPADLLTDPFPGGTDHALFSHVLDTFTAEQCVMLLAKAYEVLPSGGKISIYGFAAADDETGGPLSARLSLYLNILATGRGMAWPQAEASAWLKSVGCVDVRSVELPFEHALVTGTKP